MTYMPGTVVGKSNLEHDCGVSRSIGYFLEPLIVLGLIANNSLCIRLKGNFSFSLIIDFALFRIGFWMFFVLVN